MSSKSHSTDGYTVLISGHLWVHMWTICNWVHICSKMAFLDGSSVCKSLLSSKRNWLYLYPYWLIFKLKFKSTLNNLVNHLNLISECGRSYPGSTKGGKVLRLFIANLSQTCLTGICCSFTRTRVDVPVNPENIHEVRCVMYKPFEMVKNILLNKVVENKIMNHCVFK